MTGSEFQARLRLLGRTQTRFADEIGCTRRTVNQWASTAPPREIAYLLDLLSCFELPFGGRGNDDAEASVGASVREALDAHYLAAVREGSEIQILRAVHAWLRPHLPDPRPGADDGR